MRMPDESDLKAKRTISKLFTVQLNGRTDVRFLL